MAGGDFCQEGTNAWGCANGRAGEAVGSGGGGGFGVETVAVVLKVERVGHREMSVEDDGFMGGEILVED